MTTLWILMILSLATAQAGLWQLQSLMLQKSRQQRHLDNCTADTLLTARRYLQRLEKDNQQIHTLRTILKTLPEPRIQAITRKLLQSRVLFQNLTLAKWKTLQLRWKIPQIACPMKSLLAPLQVSRAPNDLFGPQALSGLGEQKFEITSRFQRQNSHAILFKDKNQWRVTWLMKKNALMDKAWWSASYGYGSPSF